MWCAEGRCVREVDEDVDLPERAVDLLERLRDGGFVGRIRLEEGGSDAPIAGCELLIRGESPRRCRLVRAMSAPWAASPPQIAAPRPPPAPVTTATRSVRSNRRAESTCWCRVVLEAG